MKRRLFLLLLPALLWGCGTDVDGPAAPLLGCVYGDVTTLAQSEVHQVRGREGQTLCVGPARSATGEFIYIPFFGAAPDDGGKGLPLNIEVTGILRQEVSWSSSMARGPSALGQPTFDSWLREREIAELEPKMRPGRAELPQAMAAGAPESRIHAEVPEVGDLLDFNVAISCSASDVRTGRVEHVSEHAIVVADTANPVAFSDWDHYSMATVYDTLVHPMATAHFGATGDIDGNGRTILFFTRAVNEFGSAEAGAVTLGYFWSGDLFPEEATSRLEACPAANQAEILYLIAPDPLGVAGPYMTAERVRELIIPLVGHELQHLVNASRRLFVNDASTFEATWLNEGLSHIAEELLFYRAAGLDPRGNLSREDIEAVPGALSDLRRYMWGNLSNFHRYMRSPGGQSLMAPDRLATRGATWSFLRYAADRSGRDDASFFFDLVNGRVAGLENLDRVLGSGVTLDWMQDWTVSVYADDILAGVDDRFTQPSWNFRSIFPALDMAASPLEVAPLMASNSVRVTLLPGGVSFTTFAVESGEQAVLHVDAAGSRSRALRGSLVRVR